MASTLYVFISGFRRTYRTATLNAVCRPSGSSQTFQYTLGKNVSDATAKALAGVKLGAPAVLIFIDRYSEGGYRYEVVRNASFISMTLDNNKAEIALRVGAWPKVAQGHDFSQWVANTLVPMGAPHLTASNPDQEEDGEYAVLADALPQDMLVAEDGWSELCIEKILRPLSKPYPKRGQPEGAVAVQC